jgi:hypothetical protein
MIDGRAVAATKAAKQANKLCAECGIPIRRRGKNDPWSVCVSSLHVARNDLKARKSR